MSHKLDFFSLLTKFSLCRFNFWVAYASYLENICHFDIGPCLIHIAKKNQSSMEKLVPSELALDLAISKVSLKSK